MAQLVNAIAAKPDNPGSTPGTHVEEGENWLSQLSSDF